MVVDISTTSMVTGICIVEVVHKWVLYMYITIVDKNLNSCIYISESDDHSYNKSDEEAEKKQSIKNQQARLKIILR